MNTKTIDQNKIERQIDQLLVDLLENQKIEFGRYNNVGLDPEEIQQEIENRNIEDPKGKLERFIDRILEDN